MITWDVVYNVIHIGSTMQSKKKSLVPQYSEKELTGIFLTLWLRYDMWPFANANLWVIQTLAHNAIDTLSVDLSSVCLRSIAPLSCMQYMDPCVHQLTPFSCDLANICSASYHRQMGNIIHKLKFRIRSRNDGICCMFCNVSDRVAGSKKCEVVRTFDTQHSNFQCPELRISG